MRNSSPPDEPAAPLQELAAGAQRGDQRAFEQLLRRLEPGVARVLLRRTGGERELVEELLQKTWIAVWQALREGRYDPRKAAISTFVYAVAHKLWLQHLRSRGTAPRTHAGLQAFLAETLEGSNELSAVLHTSELLDALRHCLRATGTPFSLTPEQREIVVGLASGETERSLAEQLGVVASTVHSHKLLAYKKLRRCLAAKGFSSDYAERDGVHRE
jgi:RNA polymerase sigma factor (sigma-70 family)